MAEDFTPVTTGAALLAQSAASQRKLWENGLIIAEQSTDFFADFEGGANSVIYRKDDTSKGKGQSITFTTASGFYKEGKLGDARFDGPEDFEGWNINNFSLTVDWIRHGYADNERAEELMGMRGELRDGVNVELGKWLGRKKTEQMFGAFMLQLNAANVRYANGKTEDTLLSSDTLDWDNIVTGSHMMRPLGGLPANIGKGRDVWSNVVVSAESSLLSLKLDPAYRDVLANADTRGMPNTVFKGGYPTIDGQTIANYNPIEHDGIGATGSFINPTAYLGIAIASGQTAAFDVTGGGNATDAAVTTNMFFKYFSGYAYPWIDGTTFSPAAATKYFIIYNLSGVDAGKWGFYSYANATGNNGNKITINANLAASASGTAVVTLGGVTWSGTVNTAAHPIGSLIIPANAKGVPIGHTLFLGKRAVLRGHGKYRAHRAIEEQEGGFIQRRYIWSVFGQKIVEDRKNRQPGVLRMTHAVYYPQLNLPVVTS